jgi:hypothetical protein
MRRVLIQRDLPAVSWLPSPPLAPLGWFRWCCHLAADHHAVPLASALAALDPGIYSGAVAAVARYRHFLDRWLIGWHGRVRQPHKVTARARRVIRCDLWLKQAAFAKTNEPLANYKLRR